MGWYYQIIVKPKESISLIYTLSNNKIVIAIIEKLNLMENQRIHRTNKIKLSEFNIEEIRGWIIDRMYQIETKIDFVISDYFNPEKKRDFEQIILNSSIISIGGKMKILRNIESFDKNIINKIGKFSSIRNAFAHLPITESVHIGVINDGKGDFKSSKILDVITQIKVMNSNGELKTKNVNEQIDEFFELNKELNEYLLKYKHS